MRTRISALLAASLAAAGLSFLFITPAIAGSTGLESIHTLTRQGNRLCMIGHYHFGADSSEKSKAKALVNAKRKWANFVVAEYGTDWGRFSLSASKGIKCKGNKGNGFYCSVSSSPCKLLRKRPIIKAKIRKHHYAKAKNSKRKVLRRLSAKQRWKKERRRR